MSDAVRLNLGSGEKGLDGYTNLDIKKDQQAFPLTDYADSSVDEVRASHLLEHFGHRQTRDVLTDWTRILKPGGVLKIAVPDLDRIIKVYEDAQRRGNFPIEGWIAGGQVDKDDFHYAVFNRGKLKNQLKSVGLIDIQPWQDDAGDCAALPISLNLQGTKPTPERRAELNAARPQRIIAVMSVPRLLWSCNLFCAFQVLPERRINLRKYTGAYFEQCLERAIDESIAEGADTVLTLDYDTVFTGQVIDSLAALLADHPEADAIAPIQVKRGKEFALLTVRGEDGKNKREIKSDDFSGDLLAINTAHFGCTMLRVAALKRMPRPWFHSQPNAEGRWGEGKVDADIFFWKQWEKAGNTLFLASHVSVGHIVEMISWAGKDFKPLYQHVNDFYDDEAPPPGVWT